jgi:glutathione S-transferase
MHANKQQYFMHYTEGSLFPVLLTGLLSSSIRKAPVPFFLKPITGRIAGMIDSGCESCSLNSK